MAVEIKRVALDEKIKDELIHLSKVWSDEEICYGIVPNEDNEFDDKIIYIAYKDNEIVGYLFGHLYRSDKEVSALEMGSNVFEIDELYVAAAHRSNGIGKSLFQFAEKDLSFSVDYFTLTTSNMNKDRIIHFYMQELGMSFWSARFFKKTN